VRADNPGHLTYNLSQFSSRLEQIIETALPQFASLDPKALEDSRDPSSDQEESKGSSYDREGLKAVRSPFLEQVSGGITLT